MNVTTDMIYEMLVRIQDDGATRGRKLDAVQAELGSLREEFDAFRDDTVRRFERLELTMAEEFSGVHKDLRNLTLLAKVS